MMHEKHGIVGTTEKVSSITTDRVVASAMHSQEALVEAALELVLESFNVLGGEAKSQIVEIFGCEPIDGCVCCLCNVSIACAQ
jgi:hypothetical protein